MDTQKQWQFLKSAVETLGITAALWSVFWLGISLAEMAFYYESGKYFSVICGVLFFVGAVAFVETWIGLIRCWIFARKRFPRTAELMCFLPIIMVAGALFFVKWSLFPHLGLFFIIVGITGYVLLFFQILLFFNSRQLKNLSFLFLITLLLFTVIEGWAWYTENYFLGDMNIRLGGFIILTELSCLFWYIRVFVMQH